MKNMMQLSFTLDEAKNQIHVSREFHGPLSKVWDAWTNPEILDQWWAPKPWRARTHSMNFTEGGTWRYAMVGPANEEHWCRADYSYINTESQYKALDAFTDPEGNVNNEMPRSNWSVSFNEKDDGTVVNIVITYPSLDAMKQIIELGFKEGFTMAMENLDELLG